MASRHALVNTHAAGSIQSEVRRSALENEPARNAWSGYAGQAGYHFLIAGWKVMAFFWRGRYTSHHDWFWQGRPSKPLLSIKVLP